MKRPSHVNCLLFFWALLFLLVALLMVKSFVRPNYISWSNDTSSYYIELSHGTAAWFRHTTFLNYGSDSGFAFPRANLGPEDGPQYPEGNHMLLPSRPVWTHHPLREDWNGNGDWRPSFHWLGFTYSFPAMRPRGGLPGNPITEQEWVVAIPYWFPLALLVLPFVWKLARFLLRKAPAPGLCQKCRYDLRAHKPGDRCPECGTLIPPKADAAQASPFRS